MHHSTRTAAIPQLKGATPNELKPGVRLTAALPPPPIHERARPFFAREDSQRRLLAKRASEEGQRRGPAKRPSEEAQRRGPAKRPSEEAPSEGSQRRLPAKAPRSLEIVHLHAVCLVSKHRGLPIFAHWRRGQPFRQIHPSKHPHVIVCRWEASNFRPLVVLDLLLRPENILC